MPDIPIHAEASIIEVMGGVLYRVELPNGKVILAHLSKPLADEGAAFEPGVRVLLELTPYDFDQARILAKV
jgi:translation initiation factor IF-1